MKNENEKCVCEFCGAQMKEWKQSLTPGLIHIFLQFAEAVRKKGVNEIHLQDEVSLSKSEYNNFQKLRYFGLVAKVKDERSELKAGYWLITRLGLQFLQTNSPVNKTVTTFRNKIVERSEEMVFIDDLHAFPKMWFQTEFNFNIAQAKLL